MKVLHLIPLALAATLTADPAFAADPVVARINGYEIHREDVNRELAQLSLNTQKNTSVEEIYPRLLEHMIDTKLVVDAAKAEKVDESEEYKNRVRRTNEGILTDLALRAKIKPQVTEDKLRARYTQVMSATKDQDEVRALHILLKTEAEAKDIITQLEKGGNFEKIAAEKSIDKQTAGQGGDIGYFTKGPMIPEFADAAYALKKGETSKTPVKTDLGYHVIKVVDRRKVTPPPFDKVKPQIEAQVANEAASQYVDGLKQKAKIERFNLDGSPLKATPVSAPAAPAKDKK